MEKKKKISFLSTKKIEKRVYFYVHKKGSKQRKKVSFIARR